MPKLEKNHGLEVCFRVVIYQVELGCVKSSLKFSAIDVGFVRVQSIGKLFQCSVLLNPVGKIPFLFVVFSDISEMF